MAGEKNDRARMHPQKPLLLAAIAHPRKECSPVTGIGGAGRAVNWVMRKNRAKKLMPKK
jgi:hypothetical protein